MTDLERAAWAALKGDITTWPAQIVAMLAVERERCARIAEKYDVRESPSYLGNWYVGRAIAAAIRKGNPGSTDDQRHGTETIEIRPNSSAGIDEYGRCEDVDEVCGHGQLHVEQMSKKSFWASLRGSNGKSVVMWFTSKRTIKLVAYREIETENPQDQLLVDMISREAVRLYQNSNWFLNTIAYTPEMRREMENMWFGAPPPTSEVKIKLPTDYA